MAEVIVRMTGDHIKVQGGEYVADLVRCGECRHSKVEGGTTNYLYCDRRRRAIDHTDYCSMAEPKE